MTKNPYSSYTAVASSIEPGDILQIPARVFNAGKGHAYGYVVDVQYDSTDGKQGTTVEGYVLFRVAATGSFKGTPQHVFEDTLSSGLPPQDAGYALTRDQGFHAINSDHYFVHRTGSYRNTGDHDRIMDMLGRYVELNGPLEAGRYSSSNKLWETGGITLTSSRKDTRDIEYDPDKPRKPGKAGKKHDKRHGTRGAQEGKLMDYKLSDAESDLGLDASLIEKLKAAGIEYLRQAKDLDEAQLAKIFPQAEEDITLFQATERGFLKQAWIAQAFLKPTPGSKMPKVTTLAQAFDMVSKTRDVMKNYSGLLYSDDMVKDAAKEIKAAHDRFTKAQSSGKTLNPEVPSKLQQAWDRLRDQVTDGNSAVLNKIVMLAPKLR